MSVQTIEAAPRGGHRYQLPAWLDRLPPAERTERGKEARAHARSGDRIAIAAYLGGSDVFDQAITRFASTYADQNEGDRKALVDAVASGRLTAEPDL